MIKVMRPNRLTIMYWQNVNKPSLIRTRQYVNPVIYSVHYLPSRYKSDIRNYFVSLPVISKCRTDRKFYV
jgi:hypothetical protein